MSDENKLAVVRKILNNTIYYEPKENTGQYDRHPGLTDTQEFFIKIRKMYEDGFSFHIPKIENIDITGHLSSGFSKGNVGLNDTCKFVDKGRFPCHPVSCPFAQNRLKKGTRLLRTTSIIKKECCFPFIVNSNAFNNFVKNQSCCVLPGLKKRGGDTQINVVFIENVNFDKI